MIALFQGFILQQAWDPRVAVPPYLSALEAVIDGLTDPAGRQTARPRKRAQR
jgi:hypothetical protein